MANDIIHEKVGYSFSKLCTGTTSSGVLALECPSLEALLRSMEARHMAGWFAPHMATIMELRAAMGGKDALLKALHEARLVLNIQIKLYT